MGTVTSVSASSAAPGEDVTLSAKLVAPALAGTYQGNWRLRAGDQHFGPTIWVRIEVEARSPVSPTPIEMPASTPMPPTDTPIPPTSTPFPPTRTPIPPTRTAVPTQRPAPTQDVGYRCNRCIKGNISYNTGERIYHIPGCDYYYATKINSQYGERWFSTEAEAVTAGWRKAYNCP